MYLFAGITEIRKKVIGDNKNMIVVIRDTGSESLISAIPLSDLKGHWCNASSFYKLLPYAPEEWEGKYKPDPYMHWVGTKALPEIITRSSFVEEDWAALGSSYANFKGSIGYHEVHKKCFGYDIVVVDSERASWDGKLAVHCNGELCLLKGKVEDYVFSHDYFVDEKEKYTAWVCAQGEHFYIKTYKTS